MIPRTAVLLALTVLQIVLALHVVGAVDCQFSSYAEDGSYVSYDLRPLVSPTTYIFRAKIGSYHYRYHGQQYDYLINVCDDVHPDAKHGACNELAHAPAYQVTAPPAPVKPAATSGKYTPPPPPPYEAACFRIADSGDVQFDFINASDPEEGVVVKYKGGQYCRKRNTPEVIKETNETWRDAPREVELQLRCDRDMGTDDGNALTDLINSGATIQVEEKSPPDECQYVVQWRTQHACPYGGSYQKVKPAPVLAGVGGSDEGWAYWMFKWTTICSGVAMVLVLMLCMPVVKKRFAQYQRGDFSGFGDFLGYLMGDVHVRLQQLMSSSSSLPTRHNLSHEHTV